MKSYIWIAAGGASGALLRALISQYYPLEFGFHIVAINIIGSFLLALIYTYFSASSKVGQQMRWMLGVGLMGGFTTMSTFSVDVVKLLDAQQYGVAVLYVLSSVIGGLLATALGVKLVSQRGESGK